MDREGGSALGEPDDPLDALIGATDAESGPVDDLIYR